MNEYFVNIVQSLGIPSFLENNDDLNIDNANAKFKEHLSMVHMKESNKIFTFRKFSTDKVASVIKKLNTKQASKSDDIPTMIIQEF